MSIRFTFSPTRPKVLVAVVALVLSACGGSNGSVGGSTLGTPQAVPGAPIAAMAFSTKSADLSWPSVPGATHYEVYETPDVGQDPVLLGTTTQANFSQPIALYKKFNASYSIKACSAGGCSAPSDNVAVGGDLGELSKAIGYIKASNPGVGDTFGISVALSADGNTLAVGAYAEYSATTGINGDQTNNDARGSGAVYVFSRTVNPVTNSSTWVQQAYVKASNTQSHDHFGFKVALSGDGNTLAVGAPHEDSAATGIGGDERDNTSDASGAVYVFSRTTNPVTHTGTWAQQAYVKASNTGVDDQFGVDVVISADGNTLAVAGYGEDSAASGIGGNQLDDSAINSGAVYVFSRALGANTWVQQAYIKASNPGRDDFFGGSPSTKSSAMAISADGNTLAVGAPVEDSAATGINGDQTNNAAQDSGAVYVFSRAVGTSTWVQQAYIKASNAGAGDSFGVAVALSADGNTLAVGAFNEDGAATGINPTDNNFASNSGAVYVFSRAVNPATTSAWVQQAYVKASNTRGGAIFGSAVALSGDGKTLAVGSRYERSAGRGVNGNQTNYAGPYTGAVYVFSYTPNPATTPPAWVQQAYVKGPQASESDRFGQAVALSADGNTLAVAAPSEDSAATGINGDQTNNAAQDSGAVYLY